MPLLCVCLVLLVHEQRLIVIFQGDRVAQGSIHPFYLVIRQFSVAVYLGGALLQALLLGFDHAAILQEVFHLLFNFFLLPLLELLVIKVKSLVDDIELYLPALRRHQIQLGFEPATLLGGLKVLKFDALLQSLLSFRLFE